MRTSVISFVVGLFVVANAQTLWSSTKLMPEPLMPNSIETLGKGFAILQPDLARVTLYSLLSGGGMQQQNQQAGGMQGGGMQQNATEAGGATQNATGTAGGAENATQAPQTGTATQNTSQLPQSGQLGVESQLATQAASQTQQLQQWLLQNGASNASVTEVNMLRLGGQPSALANVVFEAPLNNIQNILQNAMNNGASVIDNIRLRASPKLLQQGTESAISQAVADAQTQYQLLRTLVGGEQRQAATPSAQGQGSSNVLGVRVLQVENIEEPAPEEMARSFYQLVSEALLNVQQGGLGSLFSQGGGNKQQMGGEATSSSTQQQMPVPVSPIYIQMAHVKVSVRHSL